MSHTRAGLSLNKKNICTMNRSFLVGRFLTSHAGAFRYRNRTIGDIEHLSPEILEDRFHRRALRFHAARQRYSLSMQLALSLALLVIIGAFNLDFRPRNSVPLAASAQEVVTVQEIIQTRQIVKPPPPPRPPVPIEVPDDLVLEEDDLDLDASLDLTTTLLPTGPPPPDEEDESLEDPFEIFEFVEEMPSIIGGQAALIAALEYPIVARRAGLDGTVIVQVVIGPDGMPSEPAVVRSAHEILDEAAVDAVMQLQFNPGRQRGRAVRVYLAIPVRFRLT